jgi:hypothetical protein
MVILTGTVAVSPVTVAGCILYVSLPNADMIASVSAESSGFTLRSSGVDPSCFTYLAISSVFRLLVASRNLATT